MGDHSIPIPVFRAFKNHGPLTLTQVDTHVDWRDTYHGVKNGLSSVIRRTSEMPILMIYFKSDLGQREAQEWKKKPPRIIEHMLSQI